MANILSRLADRLTSDVGQNASLPETVKITSNRTNILNAPAQQLRPQVVSEVDSIRREVSVNRKLFSVVRDAIAMFGEEDITKTTNKHEEADIDNKDRETKEVLDETKEIHEDIKEQLKNIHKGYQQQSNLYNQIIERMHLLNVKNKADAKPVKADNKNRKGGNILTGLLGLLGLGGLLAGGKKLLSSTIKGLLKAGFSKLKDLLILAFKGFFKGLGRIGKWVLSGAGSLLKKALSIAVRGSKAAGRGAIKVGKYGARIAGKGLGLLGKGLLKGGRVLKGGAKAGARVAGRVLSKGAGRVAAGVAKRGGLRAAVSAGGRFLGGNALRSAGGLAIKAAAGVASSVSLPVVAAAVAAAAVAFGLYKVAKYFKLDEKLNDFISKVSSGKYNGIGELLWGVATGKVAVDLFKWVKNKIGTLFEDSIEWLKEKAKSILGRFNPFTDELAEERVKEDDETNPEDVASKATLDPNTEDGLNLALGQPSELQMKQTLATEGPLAGLNANNNNKAGTLYLGSNIAAKLKATDASGRGQASSSAITPKTVLKNIKEWSSNNSNTLNGSSVVLDTGLINDPSDENNVREQIKVLRDFGAKITILRAPGDSPDSKRVNEALYKIAKDNPGVAIASESVSKNAGNITNPLSKDAPPVFEKSEVPTPSVNAEKPPPSVLPAPVKEGMQQPGPWNNGQGPVQNITGSLVDNSGATESVSANNGWGESSDPIPARVAGDPFGRAANSTAIA